MKSISLNSYQNFANRVKRENRYVRTPADEKFLKAILEISETRVKKIRAGRTLWRAQLGYKDDSQRPAPFPKKRMKPLKERAQEGRANPKGIPVLYVASSVGIAMAEVRPWIGSFISRARCEVTRPLNLVDLSKYKKYPNTNPEQLGLSAIRNMVWSQVGEAFSEPVTPEDNTADYAPTQVISEFFKEHDYDGIAYKSVFNEEGYNIAFFNPGHVKIVNCALYRVEITDFRFRKIDRNGRISTISFRAEGRA